MRIIPQNRKWDSTVTVIRNPRNPTDAQAWLGGTPPLASPQARINVSLFDTKQLTSVSMSDTEFS